MRCGLATFVGVTAQVARLPLALSIVVTRALSALIQGTRPNPLDRATDGYMLLAVDDCAELEARCDSGSLVQWRPWVTGVHR